MRTVAALLLMCDPRDLGIAITEDISETAASFEPDLFLFDNYPGGIGQSQPLFQLQTKLLAGALEVLERCGCEAGVRRAWDRWEKWAKRESRLRCGCCGN